MDEIDEDGFRANVGIVLCNGHGHVLLGGRVGQQGWQFPQGGVQVEESVEAAMFRELEEEVGLQPADVEVLGSTSDWLRYTLPERYVRRNAQPLCIGQKQQWFLLRLVGDDSRVRLDTTATPEFDRWRWVDFWLPVREVIYFKRGVYVHALRELGEILFPDGLPPRPDWWVDKWDQQSRA
ncbi:MAG: RNA pyrophosphohydrolase [Gammaproteobacteria bacterium]